MWPYKNKTVLRYPLRNCFNYYLSGCFSWCILTPPCSHLSLHPTLPILATGSGQRKFPLPQLCLDSESEDSSENESGIEDDCQNCDNSIKLWVFPQGAAYSALDIDSTQCTELELCDSWHCMYMVYMCTHTFMAYTVSYLWSQILYTKCII